MLEAVELYEEERFKVRLKDLLLLEKIILYIDLTPICNCNCEYCITKVTFKRNKINDIEYLNKLEFIISNLKNKINWNRIKKLVF